MLNILKRKKENSCVLCIPDLHAPYHHKDALDFLRAVKKKYKPDRIINLGDDLDNAAISFHSSNPDLDSAGKELKKGRKFLQEL